MKPIDPVIADDSQCQSPQKRTNRESLLGEQIRVFARNRLAVIGSVIVVLVILTAVLAPVISPYDPLSQNVRSRFGSVSFRHPMGTDNFGRDILSRVMWGSRVSLTVGFASIFIAMTIGTLLGIIAGYKEGTVDQVISMVVNIMMSFPTLILGLIVIAIFGSGMSNVVAAIVFALTPRFIRVARGSAVSIKESEFVLASQVIGRSDAGIILFHILPNVIGTVVVVATLWMCTAIRIEASLSFLGLGINPPTPTWGNMIRAGFEGLYDAPWLIAFPSAILMLTLWALNMVGDSIRDILDPHSK